MPPHHPVIHHSRYVFCATLPHPWCRPAICRSGQMPPRSDVVQVGTYNRVRQQGAIPNFRPGSYEVRLDYRKCNIRYVCIILHYAEEVKA